MLSFLEDAAEAAKELNNPPPKGAVLPALDQFAEKLEYQFAPSLFHGEFWLVVAKKLNAVDQDCTTGCGKGHVLLFRMRERYRHVRDFAKPEKRKGLSPPELEARCKEVYDFCQAVMHIERSH